MRRFLGLCAMLFSTTLFAEAPKPVLALKGLDPIALADGQEVAGLETIEATHGLYRYRFSTKENKATFEAKPAECGIQFGGACGRMGPFSGQGHPDRFLVHDNKIYIFASESCRDGFKKFPELHIELPNDVPEDSDEARKRGAVLIEKVLEGFGGAKKVDAIKTYREITSHTYKEGNTDHPSTHRVTWAFPDRVRIEEEFSTSYGFAVNGAKGFQISGKQSWALDPAMRDIAWRQALRHPLAMLRKRGDKGFVAFVKGGGNVIRDKKDIPIEMLAVAVDGATSIWCIDPKTGQILQASYQGRKNAVGDFRIKYDDFREIDGLVIPHSREVFFDSNPVKSPIAKLEKIVINEEVKADLFELQK